MNEAVQRVEEGGRSSWILRIWLVTTYDFMLRHGLLMIHDIGWDWGTRTGMAHGVQGAFAAS